MNRRLTKISKYLSFNLGHQPEKIGLELDAERWTSVDEFEHDSRRQAETQHFAGRSAAKEANLKAFGTGWSKGAQWTDIEVYNKIGGKPNIRFVGAARTLCEQRRIAQGLTNISQPSKNAIAFATAISSDDEPEDD